MWFVRHARSLAKVPHRLTSILGSPQEDLEATPVPPTTSLLKLPFLGAHIRLGVTVRHTRILAKVTHWHSWVLLRGSMVSIVVEVDAVAAKDGTDVGALGMLLDLVLQVFEAEMVDASAPEGEGFAADEE